MYIFNSEMANNAANVVNQGKSPTIVSYHQTSQRNCRIVPSKPASLTSSSLILNKSPSQLSGEHGALPGSRTFKTEANLASPRLSGKDDVKAQSGQPVKSEFNPSTDGNAGKHLSPSLSKQVTVLFLTFLQIQKSKHSKKISPFLNLCVFL